MIRLLVIAGLMFAAALTPALAREYCTEQTRSVIVLIDKTSPFGSEEQVVLASAIDVILNHVPPPFSMRFVELRDTVRTARRSPEICAPGCLAEDSGCHPASEREIAEFRSSLPGVIRDVVGLSEADGTQSEIIELLDDLLQSAGEGRHDLILVSDLLQNSVNTRGFTLDHQKGLGAALEQLGQRHAGSLHGGKVVVLTYGYQHGETKSRLPADLDILLRQLWGGLFEALGASGFDFGYAYSFEL